MNSRVFYIKLEKMIKDGDGITVGRLPFLFGL